MYKIKKEKMQSLIEKLQQIRKLSDEVITSLEYLVSTQGEELPRDTDYNPDDYLKRWQSAPVSHSDYQHVEEDIHVFRGSDYYDPEYLE